MTLSPRGRRLSPRVEGSQHQDPPAAGAHPRAPHPDVICHTKDIGHSRSPMPQLAVREEALLDRGHGTFCSTGDSDARASFPSPLRQREGRIRGAEEKEGSGAPADCPPRAPAYPLPSVTIILTASA